MLDRSRGERALYQQIADALEQEIDEGALPPGARLPSEHALMARYGVSRATVVKALEALATLGLVTREQGRGTFVRPRPLERRLPELTGFSQHIRQLGYRPRQRLLSYERTFAWPGDPVLEPFPADTPLVVMRRLRFLNDEPVGLQRSALPAEIADAAGVTEERLEAPDASLYALLEAGGIVLDHAKETLTAVNADPADAEPLETAPGTALIEVTRTSHDAAGRLIEVVQARYLGSSYLYQINLVRTGSPASKSPGSTYR